MSFGLPMLIVTKVLIVEIIYLVLVKIERGILCQILRLYRKVNLGFFVLHIFKYRIFINECGVSS